MLHTMYIIELSLLYGIYHQFLLYCCFFMLCNMFNMVYNIWPLLGRCHITLFINTFCDI